MLITSGFECESLPLLSAHSHLPLAYKTAANERARTPLDQKRKLKVKVRLAYAHKQTKFIDSHIHTRTRADNLLSLWQAQLHEQNNVDYDIDAATATVASFAHNAASGVALVERKQYNIITTTNINNETSHCNSYPYPLVDMIVMIATI